jgi:hypothetical protein
MVTRKPKQMKRVYHLDNFLNPFTPETWGVLFAVVILTGVVMFLFDQGFALFFQKREALRLPVKRKPSLYKMKSFWRRKGNDIERGIEHGIHEAVDALAGGSFSGELQNGSSRIISTSFTFLVVVVLSA